jgi:hypothetical protein
VFTEAKRCRLVHHHQRSDSHNSNTIRMRILHSLTDIICGSNARVHAVQLVSRPMTVQPFDRPSHDWPRSRKSSVQQGLIVSVCTIAFYNLLNAMHHAARERVTQCWRCCSPFFTQQLF